MPLLPPGPRPVGSAGDWLRTEPVGEAVGLEPSELFGPESAHGAVEGESAPTDRAAGQAGAGPSDDSLLPDWLDAADYLPIRVTGPGPTEHSPLGREPTPRAAVGPQSAPAGQAAAAAAAGLRPASFDAPDGSRIRITSSAEGGETSDRAAADGAAGGAPLGLLRPPAPATGGPPDTVSAVTVNEISLPEGYWDAPVPTDDVATVDEDKTVIVYPLANDGRDGPKLTLFDWTLDTEHGRVRRVENNRLVYIPDLDFHGTDAFAYAVTNGLHEAYATVRVTVNPVNDAPAAFHDVIKGNSGWFANADDPDLPVQKLCPPPLAARPGPRRGPRSGGRQGFGRAARAGRGSGGALGRPAPIRRVPPRSVGRPAGLAIPGCNGSAGGQAARRW